MLHLLPIPASNYVGLLDPKPFRIIFAYIPKYMLIRNSSDRINSVQESNQNASYWRCVNVGLRAASQEMGHVVRSSELWPCETAPYLV